MESSFGCLSQTQDIVLKPRKRHPDYGELYSSSELESVEDDSDSEDEPEDAEDVRFLVQHPEDSCVSSDSWFSRLSDDYSPSISCFSNSSASEAVASSPARGYFPWASSESSSSDSTASDERASSALTVEHATGSKRFPTASAAIRPELRQRSWR